MQQEIISQAVRQLIPLVLYLLSIIFRNSDQIVDHLLPNFLQPITLSEPTSRSQKKTILRATAKWSI
jgi:hypothetical protein